MARHLTEVQLKASLSLGKNVEQWLSADNTGDYTVIRWLVISKERDAIFSVVYLESFDEGDEDFTDVVEFSSLDPDEPDGKIDTFESIDAALNYAVNTYKASLDKFVTKGMIQEEYIDYLRGK